MALALCPWNPAPARTILAELRGFEKRGLHLIQNGRPRWRRPGFSSTTSSSQPCQAFAGLSFVTTGIVGLASIYPLRFLLCNTRRLFSVLLQPLCSHQWPYLSLFNRHWPSSKGRARIEVVFAVLASQKLAGVPAPSATVLQTGGIIALIRRKASEESFPGAGCWSRTACPMRTARVIRPSETVMCDLTRRHELKLTEVSPKATDLCHAGLQAIRFGVETVTLRRKRQQGRPQRSFNPCRIPISHTDSTTALALAHAFDLARRDISFLSSIKPSTVSNHIGSIRDVIVLIQNVMPPVHFPLSGLRFE